MPTLRAVAILPLLLALASAGIVSCSDGSISEKDKASVHDSIVYLRDQGKQMRNETRYDEALRMHSRGLALAKSVNDTAEWIQALNNIATDYRRMGILDVAQEYHYNAYRMCVESTDTAFVMRKNRVVSLNGLGNIYLSIGNYERADSAFRLALAGEKELGSATGQAINYANLGSIYASRGDYRTALEYYRKSMQLNQQDNNSLGISLCHVYFGSLHEKQGRYQDALREYNAAYAIMKASKDRWHSLEVLISLSSLYLDTHNDTKALAMLHEAQAVADSIGSREHLAAIHNLYYKVYKSEGRYKDALDHHVLSTQLQDSVVDMEKRDRILNTGIAIERGRQQQAMDIANERLQSELKSKQLSYTIFALVVLLLLGFIGAMLYIQRIRANGHRILREASQMRENFFTNITHEFRTPLTVILGLSKNIADRAETDETTRHEAVTIQRQGNRLLSLITQLLDISRIKSVIGEPDWRHGNIVAQIAMIVDTYREYASNNGIEILYEYPEKTDMDFVPDYMNKLVGNLMSNSLKFTPKGGSIKISAYRNGGTFILDFADSGKGVEAEKLPHIFKPFYRADNSVTGTGVGLALVKQIIDAVGGTIAVESEPGHGTKFHITLPIRHTGKPIEVTGNAIGKETGTADAARGNVGNTNDATDGLTAKRQILIVEDNEDVADFIGSQLSPDYTIHYAANGQEGLEKAIDIVPDLIISDVMMPILDGIELCRRVRANELINHIPIIMVTARITEEDKLVGLNAGADAYLAKPFNSDELRLRVSKLLEQRTLLYRKYAQMIVPDEPADQVGNDSRPTSAAAENAPTATPDNGSQQDPFLQKAKEIILQALDNCDDITVGILAEKMGVNTRQIHRKITGIIDQSPAAFIRMVKIGKAKRMIASDKDIPLKNVALDCGFSDYSHFVRVFKDITGETPSAYAQSAH
mgnify:CR=1 FL=1